MVTQHPHHSGMRRIGIQLGVLALLLGGVAAGVLAKPQEAYALPECTIFHDRPEVWFDSVSYTVTSWDGGATQGVIVHAVAGVYPGGWREETRTIEVIDGGTSVDSCVGMDDYNIIDHSFTSNHGGTLTLDNLNFVSYEGELRIPLDLTQDNTIILTLGVTNDGPLNRNYGSDSTSFLVTTLPRCGDDSINTPMEQCDKTDLDGKTCSTFGYTGGTLSCASDCYFNTTACTVTPPPNCGNGVRDIGEMCDYDGGMNPIYVSGRNSCEDFGKITDATHDITCNADTCKVDVSGCLDPPPPPSCGNDVLEAGEQCDTSKLNSETCQTRGMYGGTLACYPSASPHACTYDMTGCYTNPCGDGNYDAPEQCEKNGGTTTFFNGSNTCPIGTIPYGSTPFVCNESCQVARTCIPDNHCGDGVKNYDETCDGADFGGVMRMCLPWQDGSVACNATCDGYVDSCSAAPQIYNNCTLEFGGDGYETQLNPYDSQNHDPLTLKGIWLKPGSIEDDSGRSIALSTDMVFNWSIVGAPQSVIDNGNLRTSAKDPRALGCSPAGTECHADEPGPTVKDFTSWWDPGVKVVRLHITKPADGYGYRAVNATCDYEVNVVNPPDGMIAPEIPVTLGPRYKTVYINDGNARVDIDYPSQDPLPGTGGAARSRGYVVRVLNTTDTSDFYDWPTYPNGQPTWPGTPYETARYQHLSDGAYSQGATINNPVVVSMEEDNIVIRRPDLDSSGQLSGGGVSLMQNIDLGVSDISVGDISLRNNRWGWRGRLNAHIGPGHSALDEYKYFVMLDWRWRGPSCSLSQNVRAVDINEQINIVGSFDTIGSPGGPTDGGSWSLVSGPNLGLMQWSSAESPADAACNRTNSPCDLESYDTTVLVGEKVLTGGKTLTLKVTGDPYPNLTEPYIFNYGVGTQGGSTGCQLSVYVKNFDVELLDATSTRIDQTAELRNTLRDNPRWDEDPYAVYRVRTTFYNGYSEFVTYPTAVHPTPFPGYPDPHEDYTSETSPSPSSVFINSVLPPGDCEGGTGPDDQKRCDVELWFHVPPDEPPLAHQLPGDYEFELTGTSTNTQGTEISRDIAGNTYVRCPADSTPPHDPLIKNKASYAPWKQTRDPIFMWDNVMDQQNAGALKQCWNTVAKYQYAVKPYVNDVAPTNPTAGEWTDITTDSVTGVAVDLTTEPTPSEVAFRIPSRVDGRYRFYVRAIDRSTNPSPNGSDADGGLDWVQFRVDNTPPRFVSVGPDSWPACASANCVLRTGSISGVLRGEFYLSNKTDTDPVGLEAIIDDALAEQLDAPASFRFRLRDNALPINPEPASPPLVELVVAAATPVGTPVSSAENGWYLENMTELVTRGSFGPVASVPREIHRFGIGAEDGATCPAVPSVKFKLKPTDQAGNVGIENNSGGSDLMTIVHYDIEAPAVTQEVYLSPTTASLPADHPWTQVTSCTRGDGTPEGCTTLTLGDRTCTDGSTVGLNSAHFAFTPGAVPERTRAFVNGGGEDLTWTETNLRIPFLESTLTVTTTDKLMNERIEQSVYRQCYVDTEAPAAPTIISNPPNYARWSNDNTPSFSWTHTGDTWPTTGENGAYPGGVVPAECRNSVGSYKVYLQKSGALNQAVPEPSIPARGQPWPLPWYDWVPNPVPGIGSTVTFTTSDIPAYGTLTDGRYLFCIAAVDTAPEPNATGSTNCIDFRVDTVAPVFSSLSMTCTAGQCQAGGTTTATLLGRSGINSTVTMPIYYLTTTNPAIVRVTARDDKPGGFGIGAIPQWITLSDSPATLGENSYEITNDAPPTAVFDPDPGSWEAVGTLVNHDPGPAATGPADSVADWAIRRTGGVVNCTNARARVGVIAQDQAGNLASSPAAHTAPPFSNPPLANPASLELRVDGEAPNTTRELYDTYDGPLPADHATIFPATNGWSNDTTANVSFYDPYCNSGDGVGLVGVAIYIQPGTGGATPALFDQSAGPRASVDALTAAPAIEPGTNTWYRVWSGVPTVTVENVTIPLRSRINTVYFASVDAFGNTRIEQSVYYVDTMAPPLCEINFSVDAPTHTASITVNANDWFSPTYDGSGMNRIDIYNATSGTALATFTRNPSGSEIAFTSNGLTPESVTASWSDTSLIDTTTPYSPTVPPGLADGSTTHDPLIWKSYGEFTIAWQVQGTPGTDIDYRVRCVDRVNNSTAILNEPGDEIEYSAPEIEYALQFYREDGFTFAFNAAADRSTMPANYPTYGLAYRDAAGQIIETLPDDVVTPLTFTVNRSSQSLTANPIDGNPSFPSATASYPWGSVANPIPQIPCGKYKVAIRSRAGYYASPTPIAAGTPLPVSGTRGAWSNPLMIPPGGPWNTAFYLDICNPQTSTPNYTYPTTYGSPDGGTTFYTNDPTRLLSRVALFDRHSGLHDFDYEIRRGKNPGGVVVGSANIAFSAPYQVDESVPQRTFLYSAGNEPDTGDVQRIYVPHVRDAVIAPPDPNDNTTVPYSPPVVYDGLPPTLDCVAVAREVPGEGVKRINFVRETPLSYPEVSVNERTVDLIVRAMDRSYDPAEPDADPFDNYTLESVTIPDETQPDMERLGMTDEYIFSGLRLENEIEDIFVQAEDYAGNTQSVICRIFFYPPVHVTVSQSASQSGTLTRRQSDNAGVLPMDQVSFTTAVSVPGTRGMLATYYNQPTFNESAIFRSELVPTSATPSNGVVEFNIPNAHSTLARLTGDANRTEYAMRFEGRLRAPLTGDYRFAVYLGNDDMAELTIDPHTPDADVPDDGVIIAKTYAFNDNGFTPNDPSLASTCITDADDGNTIFASQPITLAPSEWYGLVLDYTAGEDDGTPSDTVGLLWKIPGDGCYRVIPEKQLAFGAAGSSKFVQPYDIEAKLPPGFLVDRRSDEPTLYDVRIRPASSSRTYRASLVTPQENLLPPTVYVINDVATVRWSIPAMTTCDVDPPSGSCTPSDPTSKDFITRIPVGSVTEMLVNAHSSKAYFVPSVTQ